MQLPPDLPFSDWVPHVFDHPVTNPAWHWADDAPDWDPKRNPSRALAYLTRLFREPDVHLAPFSPAQQNQGLWYLASSASSDYAFCVLDPKLPLEERCECVRTVHDLYARCFAPLCARHYGHLDRGSESPSPLNSICYMFWDLFPVYPRSRRESDPAHLEWMAHERARLLAQAEKSMKRLLTPDEREGMFSKHKPLEPEALRQHAAIEKTCLEVMDRALELDHPACQEGALHGLGHFHHGYGRQIRAIVDAYLRRTGPTLPPELRAYALSARGGRVP